MLITPYGGELVHLVVPNEQLDELKSYRGVRAA
jgi:hypothetical protein